jgi:iron-sulfur cluster repair protein YtfE (RIC family)
MTANDLNPTTAQSGDGDPVTPDGTSIEALIDDITAIHHARLREQVEKIDELTRDIAEYGDGGDPAVLEIRQLVHGLAACVHAQLTSEEQLLFPMLRRLQHQTHITTCRAGMIRSRVMITEREFARIRGVMLRLRQLAAELASPDGPCEACHDLLRVVDALLGDLGEHAEKELTRLYPWAVARERQLSR